LPESPYVLVPRRMAEDARKTLASKNLLAEGLKPRRTDDGVAFPVRDGNEASKVLKRAGVPHEVGVGEFESVEKGPSSLVELLAEKLDEHPSNIPRVPFDVIGDVALVQVPPELEGHEREIAEALMEFQKGVRAVFEKGPVVGKFRIRRLKRLAGEGPPITVHREHGYELKVDLSRCYFNPRLATERRLLAEDVVEPGDKVYDACAGVGPIAVAVSRFVDDVKIACSELNPAAYRYLLHNLERNDVEGTAFLGDCREVAALLNPQDVVIVNAPTVSPDLVPHVVKACHEGSLLVVYRIAEDPKRAEEEILSAYPNLEPVGRREVKPYSPSESLYRLVFEVTKAPGGTRRNRPNRA